MDERRLGAGAHSSPIVWKMGVAEFIGSLAFCMEGLASHGVVNVLIL